MSDESSPNWLYTAEEIINKSPSRLAGIKYEDEFNFRYQAAQMIQDIGEKLSVFQLCTNTAIVYMHRFYMKQSFHKFKYNTMSAACLFLAAKVEEQPRKIEHVAKVVYNFTHKDQKVPDARSQLEIQDIMEEISCDEQILLQTLGFTTIVEHPHTQIVTTCSLIRASKEISHSSYVFATTSLLLTPMCLQYKPPVISCVCINVACKWSGYEVPKSAEGRHWFTYVDPTMTIERLEELSKELSAAMERNPSKLFKMRKSLSHLKTHIENEKPKPIIGQPWSGAHLSSSTSTQLHSRKPENSSSLSLPPTTTTTTCTEVLTSNPVYNNRHLAANHTSDYTAYANSVSTTMITTFHTTTTTASVTATTTTSITTSTTSTTASYHKVNPHANKYNYVSTTTTTTTTTTTAISSGSNFNPIPIRFTSSTTTTTTACTTTYSITSTGGTVSTSYNNNSTNRHVSSFSNYANMKQPHGKTSITTTTTINSGDSSSIVSGGGAFNKKNVSDTPANNNIKNNDASMLASKKNEPNAKPNRQHITDKVRETPVKNNAPTVSSKESTVRTNVPAINAKEPPIRANVPTVSAKELTTIRPNASVSAKEPQIRNAVANVSQVSSKEPQVRNAGTPVPPPVTAPARSPIKLKISGSSLSFSTSLKPPTAAPSNQNDPNSSLQRHHTVATIAPPPLPQASSSTFVANQPQEKEPLKIKLSLKTVNKVEERRPPEESNGMKVVLSKSKDGSYIQQSQLQNSGQSATNRPAASNYYMNDPLPPVLSLPPPPVQQQHHGHHHKKRKAENSSSSSHSSSHPRKHLKLDKTSQEQDSNQQPTHQPHYQQQQQRHHQQQQPQQQQQQQPRVNIQNNFNAYMSSLPFRK